MTPINPISSASDLIAIGRAFKNNRSLRVSTEGKVTVGGHTYQLPTDADSFRKIMTIANERIQKNEQSTSTETTEKTTLPYKSLNSSMSNSSSAGETDTELTSTENSRSNSPSVSAKEDNEAMMEALARISTYVSSLPKFGKMPTEIEGAMIQTKIKNAIDSLKLIDRDNKELTSELQGRMTEYSSDANHYSEQDQFLNIFRQDYERAQSFKRKDSSLEINDSYAHPSVALREGETEEDRNEGRFSTALTEIKQLTRSKAGTLNTENAETWNKVLQASVLQTNATTLFGPTIKKFNEQEMNNMMKRMMSGIQDYNVLNIAPSDPPAPTQIEVIRDKKGNIQKVNVVYEDTLDIVNIDKGPGKNDEKTILEKNAIKGKLAYSVTLDKNANPVIASQGFFSKIGTLSK